MPRTNDSKQLSRFLLLSTVCVVVAALYLAQEVLIPIALAILLSFLLAPLVRVLEKVRLPRVAAVSVSVLLAFGLFVAVGYVVYNQLADITPNVPAYAQNVKDKIAAMERPGGLLDWFSHTRAEARKLFAIGPATHPAASRPATGPAMQAALEPFAPPTTQPVPVEVMNQQQSGSGPLGVARSFGEEVMGRAGTAFIVVVFTVFMLLQREDLRDRVIRLVGRERLTTTTEALDDAASRVSRYLVFQSITNGSVGLIVTLSTLAIGKMSGQPFPSPALWGLLAMLMRFIPYVGIWLAALLPIALSIAVFTSFKWTLAVVGVFVVTEVVMGNVVEPLLFGSSTGLGSLAVLVAAAFWTWLWGPVGLLLSTPLTVCLVVMGKYVPALGFLNVLLSDEPALSPPDRVYQRLLAQDQEEAADLIHEYAKTMPVEELYDTVLLPTLVQAEADSRHGGLTPERRLAIHQGVSEVVDELGDRLRDEAGSGERLAKPAEGSRVHLPQGCKLNILCLPAHDEVDGLASRMLAQLLEVRGYCVRTLSPTELASEMVDAVDTDRPDAVLVSSLPPAAVAHARYLCKRLHGRVPEVPMIIGLWTSTRDLERARDRLACAREVQIAGGLRQALDQLQEIVQPKLGQPQ